MFVEDDDDDDVCENGDGEGENHGSINDPHYVDLTTHQTDRTVYNYQACESSELSDFRLYRLFKEEKTNYQNMTWQHRPEDDDMCLHLDNMLQICSSYRPHYHEFFVHYPARFLNSVRRVIFLGGGDAMLLHEILKYPDLELVVGLELDQQITRNSFKHFKTQPHFDDERVEWWYGDATKTLPLLPKEYWGSFDLALVDLSETVVSMSVTGQHDVLEVISMLLKPDGIMLENELYLEKMKNHFDHTIQIFYGSPKVCTQVLTMSSNGIDFLHHPINDHGVDAYLVEPMKEDHDRFKYIHDYWKTKARSQGKCQESLSANGAMTVEQGRRAGILEVLEAESTSTPLDNAIEKMLYSVIRKQGLTPVSTPSNSDGTVIVVMEEGYIVAHMLPMHRYCGFDINLWGSFSKLKDLRKALAEVVGSTSLSSYRIVVGGMHGSKTFEKDQENIGVQFSQKRNCEPDILNNNFSIGLETVATVLDETINLVQSRQLLVAVACGIEDEGICATLDIVSQNPNVRKVVPLWTCSGLTDHKNETNYQKMYDCENKLIDQLNEEIVSQSLKLDMVVFDYASPLHMFQMIASIMTVPSYREDWLKDQHVIMATLSKNENFKVEFMNEYRKKRHLSPVSKADLALKGGENSFLGITAVIHNDNYVLDHLYAMEANLRKRLPNFIVEIRRILGGELHSEADLGFEKLSFVPEKYDSNPAKVQSLQQRPVAHQSIFQLELDDEEDINDMPSFEELGLFLEKTLIKMGYHPSRFDKFTDVGNGGIIVSIFSFGNVILIFDGHTHVDINLFSFFKKKELSDSFISIFLDLSGERLEMHLRDDQPRGYGRVVSMYTGGD